MAEPTLGNNALTEDDLRRAKTDLFIALPHRVYEAFCNAEITASMFAVMLWLHRRADWSTGKVRQVSADRIHYDTGKQFALRTFQDALANLRSCGWITSHYIQGNRGSYWVTIHNYVALTGALKNQLLNPKTTKAYAKGEPIECTHECDENNTEDSSENNTDDNTENNSDGAPIQRYRDSKPVKKAEIATSQQQQQVDTGTVAAEPVPLEPKPADNSRLDRETFLYEQRMEWDAHDHGGISYNATREHEEQAFALAVKYGLDMYLDGLSRWLIVDAHASAALGKDEDGDTVWRTYTLQCFLKDAKFHIKCAARDMHPHAKEKARHDRARRRADCVNC